MAARWFKPSKDGTSLRFIPRFAPLEDRCVPATYYVDPVLAGSADGATVTFDAGHVRQTPGLVYAGSTAFALAHPAATAFSSFRAALDAAAQNADPSDTIQLATGSIPLDNSAVTFPVSGGFVNSVPVAQSLTLRGDGAGATTILPTADTQFDGGTGAVPDDLTPLFRVDGAAGDLTALDFRLDGTGHKAGVGFAVQNGAGARFDGVAVTNVVFEPAGTSSGAAVAANAAKLVSFTGGTLTGYGRTGILFFGTPGAVSNSTITGRGAGTFVNNGVELQSGSAVAVTGNRIAANAGTVAPADQSSGLLVVDDGKGLNPSTALVVGNTFTGNTVALNVGAGRPDSSILNAAYNTVAGNTVGASGEFSLTAQNLASNWWGDASGPFDPATPGGTGDAVEGSAKLGVRPVLSYPTPHLAPADASSFAVAQADYLRLITTLSVAIDPVGPAGLTTAPASVSFAVTFPVGVAANTVDPAALRSLRASDFAVTAPAGATVALSGAGAAYTLTVSGLTGTTFAVTARLPARAAIDPATGRLTAASNAATVTVAVPNAPPTIGTSLVTAKLADQTVPPGRAVGPLVFFPGDDTTPVADLVVTATSSDDTVVPAAGIVLGGAGANRTITLTNLPGTPGVSTVTIRVADAQGLVTARAFTVTVTGISPPVPPNAPPTIGTSLVTAKLADQTVGLVPTVGPLVFFPGDDTTPAADLVVTATSSDDTVVPAAGIVLGGAGANRTITLTNLPGTPGVSTVTIRVADAQGLVTARAFTVTVTNAVPVISGRLPDVNLIDAAKSGPIPFTVGDDNTPAAGIVVTVSSSNPAVVPASSLVLGGTGAGRTISVGGHPVTEGASTITLTARDAFGATATRTFAVTVRHRTRLFAVAADAGGSPEVRVFGVDGKARFSFLAFEANFTGGVRVAAADVNGDLTDDIVVAAGAGGAPRIRVLSGTTGEELANYFAYAPDFRGGAFVTTADLTGTGTPSVVTGAGPGGGPHVKAFALAGTPLQSFFAFDPAFTGGVTVAAGDLDGDGIDEIVTAAGPGGGPHVRAFSFAATGPQVAQSYFAFDPAFRGGVFVTAGTFGIAAAQGVGGGTEVRVKSAATIVAYEAAVTGGVRLGSTDLNGDGADEILVAAGPGGGSRVRAFTAAGTPVLDAFAFDTVARPGYFIG